MTQKRVANASNRRQGAGHPSPVTPGLDPGAQAETVAIGCAGPILDARLEAAQDAERGLRTQAAVGKAPTVFSLRQLWVAQSVQEMLVDCRGVR
jgi:hypothetical protein